MSRARRKRGVLLDLDGARGRRTAPTAPSVGDPIELSCGAVGRVTRIVEDHALVEFGDGKHAPVLIPIASIAGAGGAA